MLNVYKNSIEPYQGAYRAYCFNSQAAAVLNKRFRAYPAETDFVAEGSEGVFKFPAEELKFVEAVLVKFGGLETSKV